MLHDVRADDDVAHAQFRRKRAGNACVDDELRLVDERHRLRADGGVDLAHAGAGDHRIHAQQLAAGKGHAADFTADRRFHLFRKAFDLDIQSADDADHLIHFLS